MGTVEPVAMVGARMEELDRGKAGLAYGKEVTALDGLEISDKTSERLVGQVWWLQGVVINSYTLG